CALPILPRGARIALALLFAVALTLLVTPLAHTLLGVGIFVEDSSRLVAPTIISLVAGLVFYFVGWRLMVGYAGTTPKPGTTLLAYFGLGVVVCLLALVLVIIGAISGTGT